MNISRIQLPAAVLTGILWFWCKGWPRLSTRICKGTQSTASISSCAKFLRGHYGPGSGGIGRRRAAGCDSNGLTNAHIAEQLAISLKTVHNYVSNIFNKLQVADRAQAAIVAREAGLGQDEFLGRS